MKLSNLFCALAASCCISSAFADHSFFAKANLVDPQEPLKMIDLPQGDGWNNPLFLFTKYQMPDGSYRGWRIPAITKTSYGTLVAVADYRIGDGDLPNEVYFGVRVSEDNGNTWSKPKLIKPQLPNATYDWQKIISDPQLVTNPKTGTTFLFGLQTDQNIGQTSNNSDFIMFRSEDGGKTWDGGTSLKHVLSGTGYNIIFQGPGSGMYYNDKLYVAIQQWGPTNRTPGSANAASTSGLMYSDDNGKTWKTSLLVDDASLFDDQNFATLADGSKLSETSESSVFHHKGYVYLAAKTENKADSQRRVTFRTKDDGKTWERVNEDFLPKNMAICETSSYALSENIYLVGYSINNEATASTRRLKHYITTNTGRKILISENPQSSGEISGYSSITADQDNLYVFSEGAAPWINGNYTWNQYPHDSSMVFRRFDISAKEYANLNAQLLKGATEQFYLQQQVNQNESYFTGGYGNDSFGFEGVLALDKLHFGAFYKEEDDQSDDVYRTVAYDQKIASILGSYQGLFANSEQVKDNIYVGYQYSEVRYANSSENTAQSLIFGYGLTFNSDYIDYEFAFNGMQSDHDFERNRNEGLGKHASFGSYTFGFKNEFSKSFDIVPSILTIKPFLGIQDIYFKHEGFTESYANGFNEFTINENSAWSHELYAGVQAKGFKELNSNISLFYDANVKLSTELADQDDWIDSFIVLDETFNFARPMEEKSDLIVSGNVNVGLDFYKQFRVSVAASRDSFEENRIAINAKYVF